MIRRVLQSLIGNAPRAGEVDDGRRQVLTRQDLQLLLREELIGMAPLA